MGLRNAKIESRTAFISAYLKFVAAYTHLNDTRSPTSNAEAFCQTITNYNLSVNKDDAMDAETAINEARKGQVPAQ